MGRIQRKHEYFNSQPHKEADIFSFERFSVWSNFNSQPHKEADNYSTFYFFQFSISTHSLTRRLTESGQELYVDGKNFNSQPHKEADCRPHQEH